MPELPEVETTRRGIAPLLEGSKVTGLVIRQRSLRWPVPSALARDMRGQRIERVERRAKYLLLRCQRGCAILHLGMSGSLRVLPATTAPGPHDHVDIAVEGGRALRLRDPRRFGALLWTRRDPLRHRLLRDLGPEPLSDDFDGASLHAGLRGRRRSVKASIMDSHLVVGVGNIYANEALFLAGIHPGRAAGRISAARCARLAAAIKEVLGAAIEAGGTTLRDYARSDGEPGWFALQLAVYGRDGEPCNRCARPLRQLRLDGRATVYCPRCQR